MLAVIGGRPYRTGQLTITRREGGTHAGEPSGALPSAALRSSVVAFLARHVAMDARSRRTG